MKKKRITILSKLTPLSKKEYKIQHALGTLTQTEEFLYELKRIKPVARPNTTKVYPNLDKWLKGVDNTLYKVKEIFNKVIGVTSDEDIENILIFMVSSDDDGWDDASVCYINNKDKIRDKCIIEIIYNHLRIQSFIIVHAFETCRCTSKLKALEKC